MTELLKATLQEVSADQSQKPIGDPVPVQFNPSSLKLKLQNKTEGGRSRGRQRRQHNGASSTVLSMDLVFDSADEGTDEVPVSVRTKTAIVEKYVLPKEDTADAPPRLQFQWDELIIAGIVESVDIDFEHFAATGAPLRAKVSLSIKEQEPKYTYVEGASGAAAKDSKNAKDAGSDSDKSTQPGAGTNTNNNNTGNNSDQSAPALEGETAPDFLARQGLDPSAWRGLDIDLSAGLSLEAGIEVGFSAGLSASLGVGVSVGVQAEVGVSLEASLGVGASAVFSGSAAAGVSANASASASSSITNTASSSSNSNSSASSSTKKVNGDSAGLALSAAGGIQSAMETAKINETQAASTSAKTAFGLSTNTSRVSSANTENGSQHSVSISQTTVATATTTSLQTPRQTPTSVSSQNETGSQTQTSLPKADSRSASYGYGIPLRPVYPTALAQQDTVVCKSSSSIKRSDGGPQFRKQKTTPAWQALPKNNRGRKAADQVQLNKQKNPYNYLSRSCGCD